MTSAEGISTPSCRFSCAAWFSGVVRWIVLIFQILACSRPTHNHNPQLDEEAGPGCRTPRLKPPPPYHEINTTTAISPPINAEKDPPTPNQRIAPSQPATPDIQKLRNSRISSLLGSGHSRESPQSCDSREGSESSNFSALAFGLVRTLSTPRRERAPPRNMGEMSIAKLTSGVADGGWGSR